MIVLGLSATLIATLTLAAVSMLLNIEADRKSTIPFASFKDIRTIHRCERTCTHFHCPDSTARSACLSGSRLLIRLALASFHRQFSAYAA